MSATPDLSHHQLFQSHLVNCNICRKYDSAEIIETQKDSGVWNTKTTPTVNRRLCPVGLKLLEEARKEDPDKNPFKPAFFPFVAKMYQHIEGEIKGKWEACMVVDRSISAPQGYQKLDKESGEVHWRTSTARVVGYEVETDDGRRHYCNEKQIRKIKPQKIVAPVKDVHSLNLGKSVASPSSALTLKLQSSSKVERFTENKDVAGSIPASGAKFTLHLGG